MGTVDQHLGSDGRVGHAELQHIGKGKLFAVNHRFHLDIDIETARLIRHIGEFVGIRGSGRHHTVAADGRNIRRVERFRLPFHRIGQRGNLHIVAEIVVNLAGNADLIPFDGKSYAAGCFGNAGIQAFAYPHRSRYGDVLIRLGNPQVVISIGCREVIKGNVRRAPFKGLLRQGLAAVDDHFHLRAAGSISGIADGNFNIDSFLVVQDRAHGVAVQRVQDGKVVILRGINAVVLHRVIDGFFA